MKIKLLLLMLFMGITSHLQAYVSVDGDEVKDFGSSFTTSELIVSDNGVANIIGATIYDDLYIYDNGTVNMSSGSVNFGSFSWMDDNAIMTITGGNVTTSSRLSIREYANLSLFGSNFSVGGVSVGYGELDLEELLNLGAITYSVDEAERWRGSLSGILDDGSDINIDFYISHTRGTDETANITLVPEPISLCLLGLGGLITIKKRS